MSRMKKVARIGGMVVAGLILAVGAGAGCAHWKSSQPPPAVPYPEIRADTSAEGVARGRQIYEGTCDACHRPVGGERAVGQRMTDLPDALGAFYTANITQHPTAGIGQRTDAELARVIRYGVTHDNRRALMGWAMSDADVAAVIGYLRSGAPEFEPDATVQPRSEPALMGKLILAFVIGDPPVRPAHIEAPPRSDTIAYGRYMATEVYDCAVCHTAGFAPDRIHGEDAFTGGQEFVDSERRTVYSRNLTFDETGLKGWTRRQFRQALKHGISARGEVLRAPMLRFRSIPDDEVDAIYDFLQSLPPRKTKVPEKFRSTRPLLAERTGEVEREGASAEPEELFATLGCQNCHRPGAQFHDRIRAARQKPAEQLATWIRNPEKFKPGTQMPTFEELVDEGQALALANWIREGNVERLQAVAEP